MRTAYSSLWSDMLENRIRMRIHYSLPAPAEFLFSWLGAFVMATYINRMSAEETSHLTKYMASSGLNHPNFLFTVSLYYTLVWQYFVTILSKYARGMWSRSDAVVASRMERNCRGQAQHGRDRGQNIASSRSCDHGLQQSQSPHDIRSWFGNNRRHFGQAGIN
jgi:hypothetical protein